MRRLLIVLAALLVGGCSGRAGRVSPPDVSADDAAEAAIEAYDQDGDGNLAESELASTPGLAHVMTDYDANGDGMLASDEIAAGVRKWSEGKMGAAPWPFQVKVNGRALEGAIVKLVPEAFLGDAVKPAAGETSRGGRGSLGIAMEDLPPNAPKRPIVQPGLYRVEITHPSLAIPAKYNSESTLGLEVASHTLTPEGSVWNLTSGK
jgi:hypothetical protein